MRILAILMAAAALAGCELGPGDNMTPQPKDAPVKAGPLEGSGAAQTITPAVDAGLQTAAWVVELTLIEPADAKLFGVAGGDPAANGLHLHLAFLISPAEGWRVFPLGDIAAYRVLMEQPDRIDLEVDEDVVGDDGAITKRTRRMIVTFRRGPDGAPPADITVTPAA
jgi:hypothetical protein